MVRDQRVQPISDSISSAVEVLEGSTIAVITGAGISTESGIPDYRGTGAKPQSRIDFATFEASPLVRTKYWLRGHLGWQRFATAEPNIGHVALVEMEQAGMISGVITQNVDGLHRKAGSQRVVELHGNISRVVCLSCGQRFSRSRFDGNFVELNPWVTDSFRRSAASLEEVDLYTPDVLARVTIPACSVCGGCLKPDVVFFGEFVPTATYAASTELIRQSDALIVAGSSLVVNSAVRLVELARKRKMPIVIVNRGETKSDRWATIRIEAGCGEVLSALSRQLGAPERYQDIE